jgi:hypothetical protein
MRFLLECAGLAENLTSGQRDDQGGGRELTVAEIATIPGDGGLG